jgi:glycerol-3-phosphate acyltransferase PlsY
MLFLPQAAGAYVLGCAPVARLTRQATGDTPWARTLAALADALKGYLAVAVLSPGLSLGPALVATAVIAGHQWPAFWGEPGKHAGTAVLVGALAAISPLAAPLWLALWGLAFVFTGYVQASCLAATALILPAIGLGAGWPLALFALPATGMVLSRLGPVWATWRRGEEPKYLWRSGA